MDDKEAKELAERVMNRLKVDHGRHWLLWMGVDYDTVNKYTDDELLSVSEEVSSWPVKEHEVCESCGQNV